MKLPFQFTMGRMLGAVAWLCLAAWIGTHLQQGRGVNHTELISGTIACASAGLYCAARKAPIGALLWFLVASGIACHFQTQFSVVKPFQLIEWMGMSIGAGLGSLVHKTSKGCLFGFLVSNMSLTIGAWLS